MAVEFIEENCIGCKLCLKSCPYNAIDMVDVPGKDKPVARKNDDCIECGACVDACKFNAIELKTIERKYDHTAYKDIWVFCEQKKSAIQSVAYELLGEGKKPPRTAYRP